ncbi:hypothetical protein ACOSQ2_008554 [Xanthoceras sorbifolium]
MAPLTVRREKKIKTQIFTWFGTNLPSSTEHTHFHYLEKITSSQLYNFLSKLSQSFFSLSHFSSSSQLLSHNCSWCVFWCKFPLQLMAIYREEKKAKHPLRNDFASHPPHIIMSLTTNLSFNNLAPPRFPLTLSPSSCLSTSLVSIKFALLTISHLETKMTVCE